MKLAIIIGVVVILLIILTISIVFIIKNSNSKYEIVKEEEVNKVNNKKVKTSKKNKDEEIIRVPGLNYYDYYDMSVKEKIIWSLVGMGVLFAVGMVFYNSIIWSLILSLLGLKYPSIKKKSIIQKRKQKLLLQFKEALYSLSASLTSGRAVPSAFKDAYDEMLVLFEEKEDNLIGQELEIILKRIDRNETIEEALRDFADRSNIEEISTFSDVFSASIRTGGNLKRVIMDSSKMIGDKINIKQEIETLLSGKEFEANILTVIPIGLVIMMKLMAPEMINNLYSIVGRVAATVAIILILIASLWAKKIVRIEV